MTVKDLEEEFTLEDLISSMAHEIKNPIALIKANVDYLSVCDKELNIIGKKNFEVINNQLNKLVELTYECTSLMKYNNGRKINVYLYDLLQNIYSDYKESYKDIKFEFICDSEDEDIEIKGNFMLLDIAIRNLVKNSIEAIEKRGTKISIKLIRVGEITKIIIQDNGGGFKIPIEEAKEKFKTSKKNGTGLGLFITEYIIKEHGGYFEVISNESGCIATILL